MIKHYSDNSYQYYNMQVFDWNLEQSITDISQARISIITCRSSTETNINRFVMLKLNVYQYYNMQVFDWNNS